MEFSDFINTSAMVQVADSRQTHPHRGFMNDLPQAKHMSKNRLDTHQIMQCAPDVSGATNGVATK